MRLYKDFRTQAYLDLLDRIQDIVRDIDNDEGVIARLTGDVDGYPMMTVDFHIKANELAFVSVTAEEVAPAVVRLQLRFFEYSRDPSWQVFIEVEMDARSSYDQGLNKAAELIAAYILGGLIPFAHCNLEEGVAFVRELPVSAASSANKVISSGLKYDVSGQPGPLSLSDPYQG